MHWSDTLSTSASGWAILVRLLFGAVVCVPEGVQKLLFLNIRGAGRFARIGIPYPELMGPLVSGIELFCGFDRRRSGDPLIVVALVSTKLPILVGHDVGIFQLSADIKRSGLWSAPARGSCRSHDGSGLHNTRRSLSERSVA